MATNQPTQDPVAIAPHIYKVLFENERVRVLAITMPPGTTSSMHFHPDNINYVQTVAKAKMTVPDGTSMDVDFSEGQLVWQPAGSHAVENTGNTELKVIAVELK